MRTHICYGRFGIDSYHFPVAAISDQAPGFRDDIHPLSWVSTDGCTRKKIDHVLSSCGKPVRQCRVHRTFDIDSDQL